MNTDRQYIEAAEVATACGVSVYRLENNFLPDDWASPRDFVYARTRGLLYAMASLYRLADSLQARGATDAATLLREWTQRQPKPVLQPEVSLPLAATPAAKAGPDEIDAAVARLSRRHASDREELPASWLNSWEASHE